MYMCPNRAPKDSRIRPNIGSVKKSYDYWNATGKNEKKNI